MKTRVLYHIGKRPPRPVLRAPRKEDYDYTTLPRSGDCWTRPWKTVPANTKIVFLTSDPKAIYCHHGLHGNIYAIRVPNWVIKAAGGLHRFEGAPEILVEEKFWKFCEFLRRAKKREIGISANDIDGEFSQWSFWRWEREKKISLKKIRPIADLKLSNANQKSKRKVKRRSKKLKNVW